MKAVVRRVSAYIFCCLMAGAALLHVYWVLGGAWFLPQASGGALEAGVPLSLGARLGTLALIVAMIGATLLALGRVGQIGRNIPQRSYSVGCWVVAGCLTLGAALNFSVPRFWDRFVFGPIFLTLAVAMLVVAWPTGNRRGDIAAADSPAVPKLQGV